MPRKYLTRYWVPLYVAILISIWFFFKLSESLKFSVLRKFGVDESLVSSLALPFAFSYFAFEWTHLVLDKKRGVLKSSIKLKDFLVFITYFPTLAGGPVKRFLEVKRDLGTVGFPGLEEVGAGASRFLVGVFKKTVVVEMLAPLVTSGVFTAHWGVIRFGVWIYFWIYLDLSAYAELS